MSLVLPSHVRPSYKSGFARSRAESASPNLWDGLRLAVCPMLGNTGETIPEQLYRTGVVYPATGLVWVASKNGPALDLNGSAQYLNMDSTHPATNDTTGTFVCHVVNDIATAQNDQLIGYGGTNPVDDFWGIRTRGNGSNNFMRVQGFGGAANDTVDFPATLTAGTFNCLALTSDGSSWTGYYNAVEQTASIIAGSNSGEWLGDTSPTTPLFTLGAIKLNSPGQFFNGQFYTSYLWDRVLTVKELQELTRYPLAPFRRKISIPISSGTAPTWQSYWTPRITQRIVGGGMK